MMLLWQKRWVKSKGEDENEEDLISMQRRNVNQYAGGKNEESSTGRWGRGMMNGEKVLKHAMEVMG